MDKETIESMAYFLMELDDTMQLLNDDAQGIAYFLNKLHEETGEVAEVGSALLGSKSKIKKLTKKCGSVEAALIEELSDSFVVLMVLARKNGFTLGDIFNVGRQKMEIKNEKRRNASVRTN